jgi:hypothetical protein
MASESRPYMCRARVVKRVLPRRQHQSIAPTSTVFSVWGREKWQVYLAVRRSFFWQLGVKEIAGSSESSVLAIARNRPVWLIRLRAFEAVRVVVWDLDDTFWHGTLSEGGIGEYVREHHNTVIELARRGILSSICSKNDFVAVEQVLRQEGLWIFRIPQHRLGAQRAPPCQACRKRRIASADGPLHRRQSL